jgi:hypothetical protein
MGNNIEKQITKIELNLYRNNIDNERVSYEINKLRDFHKTFENTNPTKYLEYLKSNIIYVNKCDLTFSKIKLCEAMYNYFYFRYNALYENRVTEYIIYVTKNKKIEDLYSDIHKEFYLKWHPMNLHLDDYVINRHPIP